MIDRPLLTESLAPFGLSLTDKQFSDFTQYATLLVSYNEKVNLTAITDPAGIAVKHFADSVAPLGLVEIPEGASLVDVGTGAGFPGVPLKIMRPDLQLSLLDGTRKRLVFLEQLGELLGQQNQTVHARAEEAGIRPALREQFDVTTSRAVAQLVVLCEYCLPLLKVGGKMLALKGPDCEEEIAAARQAVRVLGGGNITAIPYEMGEAGHRTLVVIEKCAPTPKKFPRQRVKLSEKPL